MMGLMQLHSTLCLYLWKVIWKLFPVEEVAGFQKRERSASENEVDSIPAQQHTGCMNLNQQKSRGEQLLSNPVSGVQ